MNWVRTPYLTHLETGYELNKKTVLQSKLIIIPITFVVLILTGVFLAPTLFATSVEVVDEAKIERGVQVYLDAYCGACHILDIAGTRGTFGPAHNDMRTLALEHLNSEAYIGDSTTVEEYIRESILEPQAFLVPEYIASSHAMPAFRHLSDDDVDALVYMLVHQVSDAE